jgi:peptidoglycan/xylan/chitin deacetylase (PgdA/CDA1 family)/GT2 family glycosyltransferase
MPEPLISVILATYQRRDVLAHTLPTVLNQELPPEHYEVVVVVDGSEDGTMELLSGMGAACGFHVVKQPNRGPAAARQIALGMARGEFVLFTDDDIRFTPEVLKYHIAVHRSSPEPVMVRGAIRVAPESPQTLATDATRDWYEHHARTFAPEKNGVRPAEDFLIFANTSVPRRLVEECGGFDESVPFPQEGFELLLRLHKRGLLLRFEPRAVVFEVYSKPTRKVITSDARGLGRAEWILCQKHPDYRTSSVFSNLGQGSPTKRAIRKAIIHWPSVPNLVLDAAIRTADHFRFFATVRRAGIRALSLRYRSEVLQSGLERAGSWQAMESSFGVRLPVLMYHHVGPRHPQTHFELTIEPKQFAQHMQWLVQNGYTGIRALDWLAWRRDGTPLPEKPVLLTFDDAYADTFEYALPVLASRNFSATVFVVTAMAGQMDAWNETEASKSVLKLATCDQIRQWAVRGIEFGSHSRTHPDLTSLDECGLRVEIVESKRELGQILGSEPASFAYPFGTYNAAVEQLVRTNYELAFSVIPGMNTLCTDPHQLQRVMIQPRASLQEFASGVVKGREATPSIVRPLLQKASRLARNGRR